jgi:hypothetical protein
MRSLQRNRLEGVLRCRRGNFLGMKSGTGSLHFWVSGPYQLWPLCGQPLGIYDWSGPQYRLGLRVGGHCRGSLCSIAASARSRTVGQLLRHFLTSGMGL